MFASARRPILSAVALAVATVVLCTPRLAARDEVRALWVARTSLSSPQAIDSMVAAAQQSGFNALLVEVRARGDSYFLNGIEPRPSALVMQPSFDPLGEAVAKAHARGLALHAWINVNLVAGSTVPGSRTHIVYKHPEWLMVSRRIADDLAALDSTSPEYLGRLTRYARSQSRDLDGLYLSPGTAAAVEYTASVVRDIVSRYAVDGVHFDDVRYPSDDFDYSRETLTAFRKALPSAPALRTLQLYPAAYPDRWREFRVERLTALVTALRNAVKSVRPAASVSVAVIPQPAEAKARYLQDWTRWLADGLVDVVCPSPYATEGATFATQLAAAQDAAGRHVLWAGIGAHRLSPEQTLDDIQVARRLGASGIILFSYDTLIAPPRGSGYLSQLGKAAFSPQF
jgi:uncharacterized lipoprotein YddW (UPF0748 family)